ncbi:hypothetical protein LTR53_008384 [Teratosphaeriaceae sp. CCFEE 6253]|nr:hypothetical protein LTR53_008384 [Teratosphaeriaceae sp. CCFEE 6253]
MGLDKRRDANKQHCAAYNKVVASCFVKYFKKYAEKQIHLWLIVTHPDFRRRGAGTLLMDWGMHNEKRWPLTLFASPMGQKLYEHMQFEKVASEYIQVLGEDEKLTFAVMERHFDG